MARYHDSSKSRRAREMSSEFRNSYGEGEYEGVDSRRKQEAKDFNMFHLDSNDVANMPQREIYRAWPKAGHYANYGLDDTIGGIDKQMDEDGRKMMAHLQKGKY